MVGLPLLHPHPLLCGCHFSSSNKCTSHKIRQLRLTMNENPRKRNTRDRQQLASASPALNGQTESLPACLLGIGGIGDERGTKGDRNIFTCRPRTPHSRQGDSVAFPSGAPDVGSGRRKGRTGHDSHWVGYSISFSLCCFCLLLRRLLTLSLSLLHC